MPDISEHPQPFFEEVSIMRTAFKRIAIALFFITCAELFLAGFGSSALLAQRFESIYGGPNCFSAAYGGVQQVSTGGYISVGTTASDPNGNCTDMNIYVVRTEADGSLAWSRSYDMAGGDDYGFSIREVRYDPTGQGGFIITGYTDKGGCGGASFDLVLLRLDMCGNVLWVNTYGNPDADEVGWDVVEASTPGDPNYNTRQGDFIAAGMTIPSGTTRYDGYMVRVDGATGTLIWGMSYDGPQGGQEYLLAVDEAIVNSGSTGDIVAAGTTNSYGSNSNDGWIVRVDGNTGGFSGGSQGAAAYGRGQNEELRSIQELRIGTFAGCLVATGTTYSVSGGADVYLVQTKDRPCDRVNDRVFGDLGPLQDEGYCVREIPFATPTTAPGDLIVAGLMVAPQGLGQQDAFLARVQVGSLNVINPVMLYGGGQIDAAWSVSPVLDVSNPQCITNGFIVAGLTTSFGPVPQFYLIKTDDNLRDECREMSYDVREDKFEKPVCKEPKVQELREWCRKDIRSECQYWGKLVCLDREVDCKIERCDCSKDLLKPSLPEAPESGNGAISLSSYPNPVKAGSPITLQYTLKGDATMTVTVSDLSGRTIVSQEIAARSGSGSYGLSTEGWSSGTYMVSVTADGHSSSTRVVVTK